MAEAPWKLIPVNTRHELCLEPTFTEDAPLGRFAGAPVRSGLPSIRTYGEKPYGPKIWLVILPFGEYAFTGTEVK